MQKVLRNFCFHYGQLLTCNAEVKGCNFYLQIEGLEKEKLKKIRGLVSLRIKNMI